MHFAVYLQGSSSDNKTSDKDQRKIVKYVWFSIIMQKFRERSLKLCDFVSGVKSFASVPVGY